MEVMLGLIALTFAFFLLAFKLDDKHFLMKILSLFFGISSMLIISSQVIGSSQFCEIVPINETNTYVYGANFTGYHWDYDYDLNPAQAPDYELFHVNKYIEYERLCFEDTKNSGLIAFKLINYFIRISLWYFFLFAIWWVFMINGVDLLEKIKELFRK